MKGSDPRLKLLTRHQRRVLAEYERILKTSGLLPERALEFLNDEPEAFMAVLRSMIDQIVRSEVVWEYTMIDMELDGELYRHFFGRGKALQRARRSRHGKTLRLILENLYPLQKLSLVRSFRKVPKRLVSSIAAINELRNGLTHSFFVQDLRPSKRTYRGINIFTYKGLAAFHADAWEVRCFFSPWLATILSED